METYREGCGRSEIKNAHATTGEMLWRRRRTTALLWSATARRVSQLRSPMPRRSSRGPSQIGSGCPGGPLGENRGGATRWTGAFLRTSEKGLWIGDAKTMAVPTVAIGMLSDVAPEQADMIGELATKLGSQFGFGDADDCRIQCRDNSWKVRTRARKPQLVTGIARGGTFDATGKGLIAPIRRRACRGSHVD
jgi:hypothetical protein